MNSPSTPVQSGRSRLDRSPRVLGVPLPSARTLLRAGGVLVAGGLLTVTWGQIERRMPVVRRHVLDVPDPEGRLTPLSILQVADLHMYPGQQHLLRFLERVREEEHIDFVVSTGDNLGDATGTGLALQAHQLFRDLPGAFVLGSNDYYSPTNPRWAKYLGIRTDKDREEEERRLAGKPDLPWKQLVNDFLDMGWVDLSNRSCFVDVPVASTGGDAQGGPGAQGTVQRLGLIGVDDPHIERDQIPAVPQGWLDADVLRIGVSHAPYRRVIDDFTAEGVDLILSGHTHGGQLAIPGVGAIVTNSDLPRRYASGMHTWSTREGSTTLNVSAGLGNSPYVPLRIGARPEVSLIQIRPVR